MEGSELGPEVGGSVASMSNGYEAEFTHPPSAEAIAATVAETA